MNKQRQNGTWSFAATLVLCCIVPLVGARAEPAPAEHDGLRRLLQRYPEADLDGDGALTLDEARRYRARLWQAEGAQGKPAPATPEHIEQVRSALRITDPTYGDVAYGPLPGQTMDIWLPRNRPSAPAVLVCCLDDTRDELVPVPPPLLDGCLEAGIAVVHIHHRDSGDSALYLEDVAAARRYVQERAPAYGLDAARMGTFAKSAASEHALSLAFSGPQSQEGMPALPALLCAAVLDATLERTLFRESQIGPTAYLSANWPALHETMAASPCRPPVLLLSSTPETASQQAELQGALQAGGSEVTAHEAGSGEHQTHLLRMAALFFRQHLAPPGPAPPPAPESLP